MTCKSNAYEGVKLGLTVRSTPSGCRIDDREVVGWRRDRR